MEFVAIGYNLEWGSPKDNSRQVWFKLAQQFQKRTLNCEKLINWHLKPLDNKTHNDLSQMS
jgi:hypothetical protein